MDDQIVQNGKVVSIDYTLTVDGQVIDASGERPLEYLQGYNNIIPGLERELDGMSLNESKDVLVDPQDAYGSYTPERVVQFPRNQFPESFPLELGRELRLRSENGQVIPGRISKLEAEVVYIDTNHPLAGKELFFRTRVVGLRDATPEELSRGSLAHVCETCGSSEGCGGDCG